MTALMTASARSPEVRVGSVTLKSPVMTAAGTAGYGAELAGSGDLAQLGAVVVKSLAAFEWAGNPAPRLQPAGVGMLNAVGLQGPGLEHWLAHELPPLIATGATVVASIWGRSVAEFRRAAELLANAPQEVVAVEVNLSCPNLAADISENSSNPSRLDSSSHSGIFAHEAELSAQVIAATEACGRPRWAKLSPNTDRVVAVAAAVHDAGAEAVTLINTALGMVLNERTGIPALAAGGGGYSGRPLHPIAVRTVFDVHAALPNLPIVGVGGVASGWDAAELLLAGASAVQVGTATFADPHAPWLIQHELLTWCAARNLAVGDLSGRAHHGGLPPLG